MANDIIISTTHAIPGRDVKNVLGIVFGTTVRTRGALGRFMAGFEAIAGGKASSYLEELDKARNEALEELKAKAKGLGANAVLGVDIDLSEVLEGFIMVTATGTAVVVK